MDEMERALSVRLYDVLNNIGGSEKMRKQYQDATMTEEIIDVISLQINKTPLSMYIFGSSSEGTTTPGLSSDVDRVYCNDLFPVMDDISTAPPGISYLMVRDDDTLPGYVKLQYVSDGRPQTIIDKELTSKYNTDNKDRICYKHVHSNIPNYNRHGPADTEPEQYGMILTDHVHALRCKTIPYFVREWLYRRRPEPWLSRDDLQTMSGLGCFVVGVGHPSSREFDIEWRLSFSLQERLLMFSFNPTQHKCYIALKILKKEVIQQRIGELLSSYHCKTCMFYAIENTKTSLWKPHKLTTCLRVCFMIILTWAFNGFCPNYFVPSENMFGRPRLQEKRHDLIQVLRELVSELPSFILHLQCDCIGQMITDKTMLSLNSISKQTKQCVNYLLTVRSVSSFSLSINKFSYKSEDPRYTCLNILNHIKRLKSTRRITEHTEEQTRDAISYVIPALHLHLAQRLISFAFTPEGKPYCQNFVKFSLRQCREGHVTDMFTSRLLIVTILMRLHVYDLCETILEDLADSLKCYVISHCMCFDMPFSIRNELFEQLIKDTNISTKRFFESYSVTCLKFLPCDREIIPIPLRPEMFRSFDTHPGSREYNDYWFDWAVVDGKIYLYLLQYLIYSKLNRPGNKLVAIDNLKWVLNDDLNLHHKETGYNMLGWIYVQEGRPQDAIRCFKTSWRIRPHHNAAKFHIRKLAYDMMQL